MTGSSSSTTSSGGVGTGTIPKSSMGGGHGSQRGSRGDGGGSMSRGSSASGRANKSSENRRGQCYTKSSNGLHTSTHTKKILARIFFHISKVLRIFCYIFLTLRLSPWSPWSNFTNPCICPLYVLVHKVLCTSDHILFRFYHKPKQRTLFYHDYPPTTFKYTTHKYVLFSYGWIAPINIDPIEDEQRGQFWSLALAVGLA